MLQLSSSSLGFWGGACLRGWRHHQVRTGWNCDGSRSREPLPELPQHGIRRVYGPPWTGIGARLAFAPDAKTCGHCSPTGLSGLLLVSAGTHTHDETAAGGTAISPPPQGCAFLMLLTKYTPNFVATTTVSSLGNHHYYSVSRLGNRARSFACAAISRANVMTRDVQTVM